MTISTGLPEAILVICTTPPALKTPPLSWRVGRERGARQQAHTLQLSRFRLESQYFRVQSQDLKPKSSYYSQAKFLDHNFVTTHYNNNDLLTLPSWQINTAPLYHFSSPTLMQKRDELFQWFARLLYELILFKKDTVKHSQHQTGRFTARCSFYRAVRCCF